MPLFAIVGISIKFTSKGSVFYVQKRIGLNGKLFNILKFRTMVENADEMIKNLEHLNKRDGPVFKITNDPRCTKVGNFLRKYCIDELPQLINVLKGDMSIVGPRPALPKEVAQYSSTHAKRLGITPGLTCFWQVSERSMSFDEWVESDIYYINNRNFLMDLELIFKTVLYIFKGKHE